MSDTRIWIVIVLLGAGTFLIRFSFIGLVGARQLPEWAMRLLRYVPVAVLPAIVAPLVVWPAATGGETDAPRLLAAGAAMAVGVISRSTLGTIAAGMTALYLALWLIG